MQAKHLFEESPEGVKVITLSVCKKKKKGSKMGYTGLNPSFAHIFKIVQSGLFKSPWIAAF